MPSPDDQYSAPEAYGHDFGNQAAQAPTLRERYYDKSTAEIAVLIDAEFLATGLVKLQSDQRGKPVPRGSVTALRAYAEALAIQRTVARHEKLLASEAAKRGSRPPQAPQSDTSIPVAVVAPQVQSPMPRPARSQAEPQAAPDNRWASSQPTTDADDDVTAFERLLILDEYDATDAANLPSRLTLFYRALAGTDDQMEIEMLIGQLFRQRLLVGPRESDPLTGMHIPSAARPVSPEVQAWYEEAYAKYVHASEQEDEADGPEDEDPVAEPEDTPRQSGWLRGRFRRRP